jgi:hypothetical protein
MKAKISAGIDLAAGLLATFCNVMLLVSLWRWITTESLYWGVYLILYVVIVAFDHLGRMIEQRQTLDLANHIHVHNWNFVDDAGIPIVISKTKSPAVTE